MSVSSSFTRIHNKMWPILYVKGQNCQKLPNIANFDIFGDFGGPKWEYPEILYHFCNLAHSETNKFSLTFSWIFYILCRCSDPIGPLTYTKNRHTTTVYGITSLVRLPNCTTSAVFTKVSAPDILSWITEVSGKLDKSYHLNIRFNLSMVWNRMLF